jgi:aldehyde:ferredoxin oxidoreductase
MDYMYSGLILVIDLNNHETEEIDLEDEFIRNNIGGAAANIDLYEKQKDGDPIVLGTGFFTSTLVPGSSLEVITGRSPLNGKVCHSPLVWFAGPELKLSGYDFVVIKGRSEEPVYLWLHDEIANINDAKDIWGKDTWETTDHLRGELGDERIQVTCIGKAGENGVKYAQIINNYWGSGDKFGFAALLGEKKVKAIATRGMGELEMEDSDIFIKKSMELTREVKSFVGGRKGFGWIASELEEDISGIEQLVHRYNACFNCPYACRTFVKYRELPTVMSLSRVEEPGVLITDLSGLLKFNDKLPVEDSIQAIEKCCRVGIDQTTAASMIKSKKLDDVLEELESFAVKGADPGVPKRWKDEFDTGTFSPFTPPFGDEKSWKERVALAYVLGICPTLALLVPALSKERLVELMNVSTGWDLSVDDVDGVVQRLI